VAKYLSVALAGAAATLAVQHCQATPHGKTRRPNTQPRVQVEGSGDEIFIGIDLGGTTISVGVVDGSGNMCWGPPKSASLGSDHRPVVVAKRMRELSEQALANTGRTIQEVTGIGCCTPGLMDVTTGIIQKAANLDGWENVPLCKLLAKEMGVEIGRVVLEQDGTAAMLAEIWVGAARGCKNAMMLTLGTGVGGAIYADSKVIRGHNGFAAEIGHAILVPDGRPHGGAGVAGIVEGYGSATAVAQCAAEAVPPESSLAKFQSITCFDVFDQAAKGDVYAQYIVSETARWLAVTCINCARFVDPEVILFTGGMAQAGEQLFSKIREHVDAYHWNVAPITLKISLAEAGNSAGVIGAAYAARCAIMRT